MAVAVQEAPVVDDVVASVVACYTARREVVLEMPLGEVASAAGAARFLRSVVAPEQHAVEVVVDDADAASLAAAAWDLADQGWQVVILVPLDRLGETHGDLRGAPCVLQGWWPTGSGLSFTRPETP